MSVPSTDTPASTAANSGRYSGRVGSAMFKKESGDEIGRRLHAVLSGEVDSA